MSPMPALAASAHGPATTAALKRLSVEELMDVEIYSASRRLEPTRTTPSAIFVLTSEDLRRARVNSIPEALRLVPGVQVGRVDANKWAVSIRGFNSREANKLLVLVDGRSVYDYLFAGMLWESQDFLLEDVDRIEVIRGPGGTLWGANAVNGVINIITKRARDTQGTLVSAQAGDEERFGLALRHGWQPGEGQHARAYVRAYQRDEGYSSIAPPRDGARGLKGGFRWDWGDGVDDEVRISGDMQRSITGIRELAAPSPPVTEFQDITHRGANLIARWIRRQSATDTLAIRAYYDRTGYSSVTFDQTRHTYDFDIQQNFQAGSRHLVVAGAGYRAIRDDTAVDFFGLISVLPESRRDGLATAYLQDSIALVPERLTLTLGTKFEKTDYADSEWLPNARLAWTPTGEDTVWVAVSRAVRVPSRLEADLTFFGTIRPGDTLEAEFVTAYELGSRHLLTPDLWVDLATFYNDYDELATSESDGTLRNSMAGHTYGGEVAVRWNPREHWRLDATYSYLRMNLGLDPGSLGNPSLPATHEGLAPRHQATLRSTLDLPRNLELDLALRFVDELPTLDYDAYLTLDAGLGWRAPDGGFEVALAGQNLLDSPHPEQSFVFSSSGVPSEMERSVYVKLTWRR